MSNRLLGSICLFVGLAALAPAAVSAQNTSQAGAAKPAASPLRDFSGVWDYGNGGLGAGTTGPNGSAPRASGANARMGLGPGGIPNFGFTLEEVPMQPWAAEFYKKVRNGPLRNPNDKALDVFDPSISCFPPGPTRIFTVPRPFEIRQFPDIIYILFEWDHWVRRIYMDGRDHPDGYLTTWMGHSIGKWDGDTLVVDTVDINDQAWIDAMGHPHSDALHLVERIRRTDHDTLQIDFLFDDPKAYTKPWTGKKIFKLRPPGYEVMEHAICEDWLEMGKHRTPEDAATAGVGK